MKKFYLVKTMELDFDVLIKMNEYSKAVLKSYTKGEAEAINFIVKWYLNGNLKEIVKKGNTIKSVTDRAVIILQDFYVTKDTVTYYKRKK